MILLIKAELKKIKRMRITYVGYISILLSAVITSIQTFTMSDGTVTFADFTDMYLYNNALLFYPFTIAWIGGYIINREYVLDSLKNLLVIPVRWCDIVKAKVFILILLAVNFSLVSAILSGIICLVLKSPDLTIFLFFRTIFCFLIFGISICVGILPIVLWFSKVRGKYIWGSILAALLGVTSVFVVNGKLVNWHPVTYCFTFVSSRLTVTAKYGIIMSCMAFIIYALLSFLIYLLIYKRRK